MNTYRYTALLATDADNAIIRLGSAGCWVYHNPDLLISDWFQNWRIKHDGQVHLAKDLLQTVKRQARQFALDQICVRSVLIFKTRGNIQ